jgi:hypothetical protein
MGEATAVRPPAGETAGSTTRRPGATWPDLRTACGAGFVVWGLLIGLQRLSDNSLFTHLATGRLLLDGSFPREDPYSFTAEGAPWVVQSWIPSLVYGWADSWLGGDGVRLVVASCTAVIAALVWQLTRPATSLAARAALCGVVLAIGTVMWSPRPLLVGLIGLCCVLLAAEGRFWSPALVPLLWIWANSHGSYPLGLLALAALAAGRWFDGEGPTQELVALKWAAVGVALAAIGPLGWQVWTFPLEMVQRQEVLRYITEWQSPSFDQTWARLFLLQVAGAVLLLVRRPSYRAAVPLIIFTAAALLGTRNIPLASVVLVVGMARGMEGLGTLRGDISGVPARIALAAVVLLGVFGVADALARPAYDLSGYPTDAVAWADRHGLLEPERRVAGSETTGNYLQLVRGTDARVFVDDRFDLYPAAVIDDTIVLLRGRPGWAAVLERHGIDTVIWERDEPLAQLLAEDPAWVMGYEDPNYVVSCRRGVDCGAR